MSIDTKIQLLKMRRTKVVATLGPATSESATIEQLIHTGVNVFRLNMSHGAHEGHAATYHRVKEAAAKVGRPIAILADLCGPKIRVGKFPGGSIDLEDKSVVTVTSRDVEGGPGLIPSQYRELADDVEPGNRILLDDGNLEMRVLSIDGTEISCQIVNGGRLKDHKGMNLPGVKVSAPALTEKDRKDARFALELGVDFLALSFVRTGKDVQDLRELITECGKDTAIISKIEKPEALDNIDEIIEASSGIMVARGDLGVELSPQAVPNAQEELIMLARKHRKPVIVATQMLESMIDNPRPTRAEVSDVANAVRSGTDAIMLSGETAVGKYPVAAVSMMDVIARQTEGHLWQHGAFETFFRKENVKPPIPIEDALAESTAFLSRDLRVRAILVVSMTGRSITVMSSSRPAAPVVGASPDPAATRAACLLWGVIPVTAEMGDLDDPQPYARKLVQDMALAEKGQTILVVRGFSQDPENNTPSVTVITV